ncbi:hypothetical protein FSP39_012681 [Pinctada imbricata]|uniref:Uncharacterized protein n=1 Tax=Pinctada imbricata TaxID=66713 RepID=A0AA89C1K6_PINIB|nr:hypothetical protein FSP39_012681 [Pinctada imbricata]
MGTKANNQKPPPHEKKRTPEMGVRPGAQEESASPACMQHPSLQFGRIVTSGYFHYGRYKHGPDMHVSGTKPSSVILSLNNVIWPNACPRGEVTACALPFISANPSNLQETCSKTRTLLTCLAPHTTGCTGNVVFDSLTRSTNTMKGICGL